MRVSGFPRLRLGNPLTLISVLGICSGPSKIWTLSVGEEAFVPNLSVVKGYLTTKKLNGKQIIYKHGFVSCKTLYTSFMMLSSCCDNVVATARQRSGQLGQDD